MIALIAVAVLFGIITGIAVLASIAVPAYNRIKEKAEAAKAEAELDEATIPLTAEERERLQGFAGSLAGAIANADIETANTMTDYSALTDRSFRGLSAMRNLMAEKRGFLDAVSKRGLFEEIAGSSVTPMVIHEREGIPAIRMRVIDGDGGVNYLDLLVRREGDSFRVIDLYSYLFGSMTSAEARMTMAAMMATRDDGVLGELLGVRSEAAVAIQAALGEMNEMVRAGDLAGVRAFYHGLDEDLKGVRVFYMRYFMAVQQLQAMPGNEALEGEYLQAIRQAPQVLGEDATTDLLMVDALIMDEEWDEAMAALDRVAEIVGGDAYLTVLKGTLSLGQNRMEDVAELIVEAESAEPELLHLVDLKLEYFARTAEYDRLADTLRDFSRRFGVKMTVEDFEGNPAFTELLESEEFKVYSKEPIE